MSQAAPIASFLPIFTAALDTYEKTTKKKLFTHPLAAQLQSCDSSTTILSVLQDLAQQLDESRSSDQRLTNWLNPTVNVLFAFSATLGEGVGLVGLESLSHGNLGSDFHFSGIVACESDICWDRCPSFGEFFSDPTVRSIVMTWSIRQLRMSMRAKMCSLIYSHAWRISLSV